jgi:hypothetical protein
MSTISKQSQVKLRSRKFLILKQNKPCLFQNFKDWSEVTYSYSRTWKDQREATSAFPEIRKIESKRTLLIQELKKNCRAANSAYSRNKKDWSKANSTCSTTGKLARSFATECISWTLYKVPQCNAHYPNSCLGQIKL